VIPSRIDALPPGISEFWREADDFVSARFLDSAQVFADRVKIASELLRMFHPVPSNFLNDRIFHDFSIIDEIAGGSPPDSVRSLGVRFASKIGLD
jgi:hypothetical protein